MQKTLPLNTDKRNSGLPLLDEWVNSTMDDEKVNVLLAKQVLYAMMQPANISRLLKPILEKKLFCYFEEEKMQVLKVNQIGSDWMLLLNSLKKDKAVYVSYTDVADWRSK